MVELVLVRHAVGVVAVGGEDGDAAGLLGDTGSGEQV